ncbi:MAG: hypothetical protein IJ802_00680 [Kiritimatiellae bacterium]|nr:hypothetical protein [Kiritimatiellia bacterium]
MKRILCLLAAAATFAAFAAAPVIPERDPNAKPWKGTKKPVYSDLQEALDVSFALEQPILLVFTLKGSQTGKELVGKVIKNATWTRDYASKNLVTLVLELPQKKDDNGKAGKGKNKGGKGHDAGKNAAKDKKKYKGVVIDLDKLKEPERAFVESALDKNNNKWPYSWLYFPYRRGERKPCLSWKLGAKPGEYYEIIRVTMESLGMPAEFTPALKRMVDAPSPRR